MKKTLLSGVLLLALLMTLSFGAFAETADAPADETILMADLTAFMETGELFEGIKPGMSLQEVLSAGLPLKTDTWIVPMLSEESKSFDSPENHVVMMEGIRFAGSPGLGAFSCLFRSDALAGITLYMEESMLLEEILPILASVLGEPSNQNTTENKYMHELDLSMQTYITTNTIWEFDLNGELVAFSFSARDDGKGANCWNVSVTYMNYDVMNADDAE